MLELTGIAPVLRALGILYWALAAAAIAAALWLPKKSPHKAGAALLVAGVFAVLPVKNWVEHREREAYAQAAWAHFRKLCAEKAGEKIYKTFTGVKSVLVVKPLPPATDMDHFNQYWYGDPYSRPATSVRTEVAISTLVWSEGPLSPSTRGAGFEFAEAQLPSIGSAKTRLVRFEFPKGARDHTIVPIDQSVSRFAVGWEDISTEADRAFWVAGSRFVVKDLLDNSLIAERVGYFIESGFGSRAGGRRPWLTSRGPRTTCPPVHDYVDRWFLIKVLGSNVGAKNGN